MMKQFFKAIKRLPLNLLTVDDSLRLVSAMSFSIRTRISYSYNNNDHHLEQCFMSLMLLECIVGCKKNVVCFSLLKFVFLKGESDSLFADAT
jgi:hypothetical protein